MAVYGPTNQVFFTAKDPTLLEVSVKEVTSYGVRLYLKALGRGTPVVQARLGSATGPILAEQELDEFILDTSAVQHLVVNGDTDTANSIVTMSPWIPNVDVNFAMFAHYSTFAGGATAYTLNTSDQTSVDVNGDPAIDLSVNPTTGETQAVIRVDIEMPADEDSYCFSASFDQHSRYGTEMGCAHINGKGCYLKPVPIYIWEGDLTPHVLVVNERPLKGNATHDPGPLPPAIPDPHKHTMTPFKFVPPPPATAVDDGLKFEIVQPSDTYNCLAASQWDASVKLKAAAKAGQKYSVTICKTKFADVITVIAVDLVIDSDNNNGYGDPSGDINEIIKEDEAGWPGKALALNELDRDGDGTPDFADGYDSGCGGVSHRGTSKSADFVPMMLKIPASVNNAQATVSFTSGTATDVFSNPEKVVQTGNGTSTSPFVCSITDKGKIRIWTVNGTSPRLKAACPAGDWVQPNTPILVSALPNPDSKGNIKLFVEAVQGSKNLGDVVIKVELDPDGSTGLEPKTSDQVAATVFHIEEVHPITSGFADGQSGKVLISTRQDDLYYTTASTTAAGKPAQTMDTNVTISAYIIPVPSANYPGLKAYFEVIDPDDRSHYEGKPAPGTPTVQGDVKPNDNRDPIKRITWELDGTSKGYHEYQKECLSTRLAAPVFVSIGGVPRCVAETTLLTTDRHSGDNYRIRATLRDPEVGMGTYIPCFDTLSAEGSNVVSTIKQSATLIAWKRVYIEQDEMYTLGCTITNAYDNVNGIANDELTVDNADDLKKDDEVTVFWRGGSVDVTVKNIVGAIVTVTDLGQNIPVSSGIRPLNHTDTVTVSQQYLQQAFGSLPDGIDGGAFIEFKPVPGSGSGKTPKYKYMPGAPQDRFIDYHWHWFDNKSQYWSNVLYLLAGHDAQDKGWCKPIASVCIVLTVGRTEMSQRETVVHEIGHRFVRESDVGKGDYAYLEKLTNKKSHDGSEYCVMNYSNGLAPNGITEFSIEYLLTGSAPTEKNSLRDCEDK